MDEVLKDLGNGKFKRTQVVTLENGETQESDTYKLNDMSN
jgi:hypothetical protein